MIETCWQPSATIATLKKKSQTLQSIRHFFHQRGYWEVETPVMGRYGVTDVYLNNIEVECSGRTYYLQTSPEYHMKRLLAAGSGPIFQIARAFRDEEQGRWHNPEFHLLEWYQLAVDHHGLMVEVDELLQSLLQCPPLEKIAYRQAFQTFCDIDPMQASLSDLRHAVGQQRLNEVLGSDERERDTYLFLLLTHVIEPQLAAFERPIVLYDFPPSQAALAKTQDGIAERFEVYYRGLELANGFHELTDVSEQLSRFERDNVKRKEQGKKEKTIDPAFIQALEQGLPSCSGVAMGIDRLIALLLEQPTVAQCLSFDMTRC